jgi:NADH-quinone oxidoreductase subunit M
MLVLSAVNKKLQNTDTLLSTLLLVPLVGAALILLLPAGRVALLRYVAGAFATAAFLYSCALAFYFDPAISGFQLSEARVWNPRLGSSFALGLDGISLSMVLLASLLTLVAIIASGAIRTRAKGYYSLMLFLETAMLGVFLARDWSLFYAFWELTLIPLFLLIDRWGGANRHRAALNFVLYTMGGAVFLLVALLVLYDAAGLHSFEMARIATVSHTLSAEVQAGIFLGLLIGFGVKMPIVPLHGWLPLAHVEAPSPVSILLSGVLLKMGSYGLIRAAETLPAGVAGFQQPLAIIGFVSLLYGAVLAWRQRDLKAMIAYSSISHMGVVMIGIATLNNIGVTGAVVQMVAHGLVAGGLFLLIGLLYERTHTRDIADYSSLVRTMPRFAFFTVLMLVAAIGLPGTAGFIAELHALIGGYERWGMWVALFAAGMLVTAGYAVRTTGRLFTGPIQERMRSVPDLNRAEFTAIAALAAGVAAIGLAPAPLLNLIAASVQHFVAQLAL